MRTTFYSASGRGLTKSHLQPAMPAVPSMYSVMTPASRPDRPPAKGTAVYTIA